MLIARLLRRVRYVSNRLRDLGISWRLLRSGLFDADQYQSKNPDVPRSRGLSILHFVSYGQHEERFLGQAPISNWLIPEILNGSAAVRSVRALVDEFNVAQRSEQESIIRNIALKLDLDASEYWFLAHDASDEFNKAYDFLVQLPWHKSLTHRFRYAQKHMRTEALSELCRLAFSEPHSLSELDLPSLIALRDMSLTSNTAMPAELDLNRLILDAVSKYPIPDDRHLHALLWRAGYPVFLDEPAFIEEILPFLPESITRRLSNTNQIVPESTHRWKLVMNAMTATRLSRKDHALTLNRDQWGYLSDESPCRNNDKLEIRILGEEYWRQATFSAIHDNILRAFKAAVLEGARAFSGVCVRPATRIYDVRDEQDTIGPTLSYHTLSARDQNYLNFKESALPGYYLLDHTGFSGWASVSEDFLDATIDHDAASRTYEKLYGEFVEGRVTKYPDEVSESSIPKSEFILVALQLPHDSVQALANFDQEKIASTLIEAFRGSNTSIVFKLHPLDKTNRLRHTLQRFAKQEDHVRLAEENLFELLSTCKLVVTTNSGVGMEALLRLKPVITVGGSDYESCAYMAKTPEDLARLATDLVAGQIGDTEIEKIKAFLHYYFAENCFHTDRSLVALTRRLTEMKAG